MHYASDKKAASLDKIWTTQELVAKLRKIYSNREDIIPDDEFYGRLKNKDSLEKLGNKIEKQLKIKSKVTYNFSPKVKAPGECILEKNNAAITVPVDFLGKPLFAAANLSHLLAHVSLNEHNLLHIEPSENERLADIATMVGGLGIVVVNGMHRGGWKTAITKNKPVYCLGYVSTSSYVTELGHYLPHEKRTLLAAATVVWERKNLFGKPSLATQPRIIKEADNFYRRSLSRTLFISLSIIISVAIGYSLGQSNPSYSDAYLLELRDKATTLQESYLSCRNNLEELKRTLPDEFSSGRTISAEQGRCKSLENRYNSATERFNHYLQTTEQIEQ